MTETPYAIVTPCFNEEQSVITFLQQHLETTLFTTLTV